MKFGKNLQKVVDISDPEWAPYWTNYKMLKKLIKELPTLVPTDERLKAQAAPISQANNNIHVAGSTVAKTNTCNSSQQHNYDVSAKKEVGSDATEAFETNARLPIILPLSPPDQKMTMGKSPGEVAFFKLLHSEFKKSCCFFRNAEDEMAIREARIQEGNEIMQAPNSIMVNDRWSLLSKSLHRLYKDLLLLETYAIMTYVTFSKILKKHDKITGFTTRAAFMENVVSKANFTTYPRLIAMINRTEALYEEVSARLLVDGKDSLYEDERLFINMIHRLNNQTLENEDAPNARPRNPGDPPLRGRKLAEPVELIDSAASSLQSLVEYNEAQNAASSVSDDAGVNLKVYNNRDVNEHDRKRSAITLDKIGKRQRSDR